MSNPAVLAEKRTFPISRVKDGEWEFVLQTEEMDYAGAMLIARELQEANAEWQYRIWDCR